MISLIILGLFILVAAFFVVRNRASLLTYNKFNEPTGPGAGLRTPIIILVLGIFVSLFQPYAVDRVDSSGVGVVVNLSGDNRGIADYRFESGWVYYNTWTTAFFEFPTYQQHVEYEPVTVITKGGFSATIKPTFNYKLISGAIGDMFLELRLGIKEIQDGWLKNAIIGSINDVANKWPVDDIFNKRQEFEAAIVTECNLRVSRWFNVSQLRTNITPPKELREAILAKTKAVQDAQAKMQEALVAEANAKKMIAEARGDSAQAVINASGQAEAKIIQARGEAEAMKLKQREITPLYIEFIKATNWNGAYPTTIAGNSSLLMSLPK
jgi:regulator of protease activity HflC (stomatin/prohibitin superfamily)